MQPRRGHPEPQPRDGSGCAHPAVGYSRSIAMALAAITFQPTITATVDDYVISHPCNTNGAVMIQLALARAANSPVIGVWWPRAIVLQLN